MERSAGAAVGWARELGTARGAGSAVLRPSQATTRLRLQPSHDSGSAPSRLTPQVQLAILSDDTITMGHVSNRATQGGSRHTWRLRGASGGWCRRLPAPKAETSARRRPSTTRSSTDLVVTILWNEPHLLVPGCNRCRRDTGSSRVVARPRAVVVVGFGPRISATHYTCG